jgi:hypothetical protein
MKYLIFYIVLFGFCIPLYSQSKWNRCFIDGFRLAAYDANNFIGDLGLIDSTKPYNPLVLFKNALIHQRKEKNAQPDLIQNHAAKQYIPSMFFCCTF